MNIWIIKYICISHLDGMGLGSSNYLGVGNDGQECVRRKSDSRLDMHQISHLQKIAANAASASNTCQFPERTSGVPERNSNQSNYHQVQRQQWEEHQNFQCVPSRGGNSEYSNQSVNVEYDTRSDLGPYQIIPPQTHHNQHVMRAG